MSPPSALDHAEHVLQLVKSISQQSADIAGSNPLSVYHTKIEIQDACNKLLQSIIGPLEYTMVLAESYQESQALHFVTVLGIPDLIGDDQASLAILSARAGVLPQFLGMAMSCLIGCGYFLEVGHFGSRIYRNNELSNILRETHPTTVKAAVGFVCDEGFRSASRLLDAAKVVPAGQKSLPASNIAFGFSGNIFDWMALPGEAWRGERLGMAMQQLDKSTNIHISEGVYPALVVGCVFVFLTSQTDYPWHELSSPIIDVGGGIGSLETALLAHARHHHLQFIIFDLPKTVANAREFWNQRRDVANCVSFMAGNFLAPTLEESNLPVGQPTYVIRHVLNDWPDAEVIEILSKVRQAMLAAPVSASSRLLIVEMLFKSTSSRFQRASSLNILGLNNGVTRTLEELEELVRKSGLKVERVTHMRALDTVITAIVA